jgi:hypothetical protein
MGVAAPTPFSAWEFADKRGRRSFENWSQILFLSI